MRSSGFTLAPAFLTSVRSSDTPGSSTAPRDQTVGKGPWARRIFCQCPGAEAFSYHRHPPANALSIVLPQKLKSTELDKHLTCELRQTPVRATKVQAVETKTSTPHNERSSCRTPPVTPQSCSILDLTRVVACHRPVDNLRHPGAQMEPRVPKIPR